MTTTNATSLTAEQATEQLKAWFAAGLPQGQIVIRDRRLNLIVAGRDEVDVWALALGARAVRTKHMYGLDDDTRYRPAALPGWSLDVLAHAGELTTPITIEVEVSAR